MADVNKTKQIISLRNNLGKYYIQYFPYEVIYKWLYTKDFPNREFSFCDESGIYNRYNSFINEDEFCDHIKESTPFRIDIGAIFDKKPHKKNKITPTKEDIFKAKEKEFTIDIDITDYSPVRLCPCSDNAIFCKICWPLINLSIFVITDILKVSFGYNQIYWIFSGKKGVHCWVKDRRAMILSDEDRTYIARFIQVIVNGVNGKRTDKILGNKTVRELAIQHPTFLRIYKIYLQPFFERQLQYDQFILNDRFDKILYVIIQEPELINIIKNKLNNNRLVNNSFDKWDLIKYLIVNYYDNEPQVSNRLVMEIIFMFVYPRIDEDVSKSTNHLLKSPFVVHPDTLKICIPICSLETIDNVNIAGIDTMDNVLNFFNPFDVPTVNQLIESTSSDINLNFKSIFDKAKGVLSVV
jgi:DNA primase small subunit